jgi:hypothetical protein
VNYYERFREIVLSFVGRYRSTNYSFPRARWACKSGSAILFDCYAVNGLLDVSDKIIPGKNISFVLSDLLIVLPLLS